MTDVDLCPICKKPKESTSSGLVTQLIDICRCGFASQDEQAVTVTVCSNCGKRLSSREGSLTQWIFGKDRCECSKPKPIEKQINSIPQTAIPGFSTNPDDEVELKLDPENFPVDRFKAVAEIGKGTSGLVYLCRDKLLGKKVAVKALRKLSPEQLIAFQEEARATSKLNHPNIVNILDMGATESGSPYIVLDYIEGTNLQDYLTNVGVPDIPVAIDIFLKLASALEYAHEQKIFHRDIKPSNIVVYDTDDGIDVKLIDFGVAIAVHATQEPTIFQGKEIAGTPAYMSPDSVNGLRYDERSEVYSLGCVLFEILTGQQPYSADTALELLKKHAHDPVPDPVELRPELGEYPELVETIIKTMQKEPDNRVQSMRSIQEHLQEEQVSPNSNVQNNNTTNQKAQRTSLPAVLALGFVILSLLFLFPFVNFLSSEDKDKNSIKQNSEAESSANKTTQKGEDTSDTKNMVTKCVFEGTIGGESIIYFTEDKMRIEWRGVVTMFLCPPDYTKLKIQYVSIKGFANETLKNWLDRYAIINPSARVKNVQLIGKENLINLPCNHYRCEVGDTTMDFWTTSTIPLDDRLKDAGCKILDVPTGFGLPIKATRTFTCEQAKRLLTIPAAEVIIAKPWKGEKTINWMKVTSIEPMYTKESYSDLFPADAFKTSLNLD